MGDRGSGGGSASRVVRESASPCDPEVGADLPSGEVTFVFTDIEGSTRLFRTLGASYAVMQEAHRRLIRDAFIAAGGVEVKSEGDGLFFAFARASGAVVGCVRAQLALAEHPWEHLAPRVRMGMHTGQAAAEEGDYVALAVNLAARVSAAANGGQVLLSESAYELVAQQLPPEIDLRDLGVYDVRDFAGPVRLYQAAGEGAGSDEGVPRAAGLMPNNLPVQRSTFLGRSDALVEIDALVRDHRLVSLIGPGGAGKTRLAIRVGRLMLPAFQDGVWFVDLSEITREDLVALAVATAVGVPEDPSRASLERLLRHLNDKKILLILDNCEHVIDGAAEVVDQVLSGCEEVSVLTTTRAPLEVYGETRWRIDGLQAGDAVGLFIERARQARADLAISAEDAARIAELCRHLDGLPLAIELAAARARDLSLKDVVMHADARLVLARSHTRGRAKRQQSLEAVIDWSFNLLDDEAGEVLARIAVMRGEFDADAARAVTGTADVNRVLRGLADQSLLVVTPENVLPYRLLETIREFAHGRLSREQQHDSYEALAVHQLEVAGRGVGRDEVRRLAAGEANMRVALNWWLQRRDPRARELCRGLGKWWLFGASRKEGMSWTEQALDVPGGDAGTRAVLLALLGRMQADAGESAQSAANAAEAVTTARVVGDQATLVEVLRHASWAAVERQDLVLGRELAQELIRLGEAVGDLEISMHGYCHAGGAAYWLGLYAESEALQEEFLRAARASNSQSNEATALFNLAELREARGDVLGAQARYREVVRYSQESGNSTVEAAALLGLGRIARMLGHQAEAFTLLLDAERVATDLGVARLSTEISSELMAVRIAV